MGAPGSYTVFLPNFPLYWYNAPWPTLFLHLDYFSWFSLHEFKVLNIYKYVQIYLLNLESHNDSVSMVQFNLS